MRIIVVNGSFKWHWIDFVQMGIMTNQVKQKNCLKIVNPLGAFIILTMWLK